MYTPPRSGLSPKQRQFVSAVLSRKYKFLLYGGGVGGGKTVVTLGLLDELAQQYPNTRYAVVRKSLTTIRRNTIPSFTKILALNGNPKRATLHKGEWTYKYKNGSEILFVEADITTDPELNKLKGLEVTMALFEEANELVETAFAIMITRVGRWMNTEYNLPAIILFTCNPDNNWVKFTFYDKWASSTLDAPYYFLQALPKDNPFLSQDYIESLEYLPEAEYNRYVLGNWDYSSDPNQLIRYEWLKAVQDIHPTLDARPKPTYIGIDVAREGNDKTTMCFMTADLVTHFEDITDLDIQRAYIIADRIQLRMSEYGIPPQNVAIDGIGPGGGVLDELARRGVHIVSFKSSEKPSTIYATDMPNHQFYNKRAEAHWALKEDIKNQLISFEHNPELVKQALLLRYLIKDKIIIESKLELKKRLGFSPDMLDSLVIANYIRRQNILNRLDFSYVSNVPNKTAGNIIIATPTMVAEYIGMTNKMSVSEYVGARRGLY